MAAPQEVGVTVLSDENWFNHDWADENLVIRCGEKEWVKPIAELMDQQMRIYTDEGAVSCSFVNTEWADQFLGQVSADLKNPEMSYSVVPEGHYYQLVEGFKPWYLGVVQNQLINGKIDMICVTLNENTCYLRAYGEEPSAEEVQTWPPEGYILAGTCTTSFRGSSAGRINNIYVASAKLNGLTLANGATASLDAVFTPRTVQNGYKEGGTFIDGEVVQALGGGICQVSSTAYNALMNAGVTVTRRYTHSSPVSYLPLGMDATISAGSKDLQFRNDYPNPIIMEAVPAGRNLTVNVYVKAEDLAGRSYRLWAVKTGPMSAKTYLTVYENNVEVEVREVGSSKYKPLKK